MKDKLTIFKIIGHFNVVVKHKWNVFKLCCKVGIPIQGLLHDMSKFSPIEFFESARYYTNGTYSPIRNCKEKKGYSMAWIHHKNHNKHHYEYWYDYNASVPAPIIPFKYVLELICDSFAAGMTYQGSDWHQGYQLEYWNKVMDYAVLHPNMKAFLTKVYELESKEGLNSVLNKNKLKSIYDAHTINCLQKN